MYPICIRIIAPLRVENAFLISDSCHGQWAKIYQSGHGGYEGLKRFDPITTLIKLDRAILQFHQPIVAGADRLPLKIRLRASALPCNAPHHLLVGSGLMRLLSQDKWLASQVPSPSANESKKIPRTYDETNDARLPCGRVSSRQLRKLIMLVLVASPPRTLIQSLLRWDFNRAKENGRQFEMSFPHRII